MNFAYLAILTWIAASLIMPRRAADAGDGDAGRPRAVRLVLLAAVCAALCALLACSLAIQLHAAHRLPFGAGAGPLPIVMLDDTGEGDPRTSNAELCVTLAETACLFALYRILRRARSSRGTLAVLGASFAVLASIAVASPVANSSDLYGYVGFALQPDTAYAPADVPFTGDHAALNVLFGTPRPAAWYGPLWIALTHVLLLPFASLAAQLLVLRLLEAGALASIVALLARSGTPLPVLALLAVNPAVFDVWVVDGHNDLFGVALVIAALAARRSPLARVALVAAAGLVKLPLVLVGAVAFADETPVLRRVAYAAGAVAACLAVSYAFGGTAYLGHLFAVSGKRHAGAEGPLHAASAFAALAALAAVVLARRRTAGAAWIWRAFAAFPAPWYALWGLPYALGAGVAALVLIAEPIDAYLFSWNYAVTEPELVLKFAVLIGPVSYALIARMSAHRAKPAPGPGPGPEGRPYAPGELGMRV